MLISVAVGTALAVNGDHEAMVEAFDRITIEEAAKRVSQCNLGPITFRHDPDIQEDVMLVAAAETVTDQQLECADKGASFYTLELPPHIQRRYDAIRTARFKLAFDADARAWLSARGLLGKVPEYRKGVTDDSAFTRRVEELCGPRAKGAFQSTYGFRTLDPAWIKREMQPPEMGEEVFTCIVNVTSTAGFELGFVGNEAYRR